jgi:hypothetical protein
MLLAFGLSILMSLICFSDSQAQPREGWYFTAQEIAIAFRYQEQFGGRLSHPLKPSGCLNGKSEFEAFFRGNRFAAPCRFITETMRHIKEMLEIGAAKYLFPLDADHAHLAVPSDLWEQKYRNRALDETFPEILRETSLVALYHSAEHLTTEDQKTGKINLQAKPWQQKRNVLGFYDGRTVQVLLPDADGVLRDEPKHYRSVGTFSFMAHRLGELVLSAGGQAVIFDISFDDDLSAAMR